jgi:hypothetical protein
MLTLLVERYENDTAVGFEGYPAHTHPSVIAAEYGFDEAAAVEHYIDAIVHDRLIIVVQKNKGEVVDIWVAKQPPPPDRWAEPDEERVLRYWTKPFEDPADSQPR